MSSNTSQTDDQPTHLFPPKRRRVVRMRSSLPPAKRARKSANSAAKSTGDRSAKRAASVGGRADDDNVRRTVVMSGDQRSPSGRRAAAATSKAPGKTRQMTGTVTVGTFEPLQEHAGKESLASLVQVFNSTIDKVNAESRDERVHSYRCLPRAPDQPIDWSRDDIEIRDEWFMPRTVDEVVDNGRSRTTLDRWLGLWVRQSLILPRVCVAMV